MKRITTKGWFIGVILCAYMILGFCALLVIWIDPYFHYRKPDNGMRYSITNERNSNDGILKHFTYDAVITGSSMCENFKTSEFDELFQCDSIKIPFSGASFKEINDNCRKALLANSEIKYILRGLDLGNLTEDKDVMSYSSYPVYLYDDKLYNDVNYWLNKNVLLEGCGLNVILQTLKNGEHLSFDHYANWNDLFSYGREIVLASYVRPEKVNYNVKLSESERITIRENIAQNVVSLSEEYPDTEFIVFLTPYSICWWDQMAQSGKVEYQVDVQRETIETLITSENIQLYSFCNNYDLICNLDNYRDAGHYNEKVNSEILQWIKQGKYQITKDNYEQYLKDILDFYQTYDYDSIYK